MKKLFIGIVIVMIYLAGFIIHHANTQRKLCASNNGHYHNGSCFRKELFVEVD